MTAIAPGARLGPYEIVAPLGAGGMGEVWRGRDTRLDRSVAIKVLPAGFADNVQLQMRFEREAKTISQLNDPHICTLYDVGHENGTTYLVMELLEGESLADRIARGALPLSEVLKFGIQIAHALDRAHRSGIVHRDLKPGNIMITRSGAKLLDFGLARSTLSSASPADATQQKPLTQEGTILGTYQYMSPEQIAGEEADARSDIFSFGAVLYEMLTGRRAFEGKTKTSLVAAIVGGEPRPAAQLQPLTPASLEHIIAKCLAKEADARWQSAADIASELEWISSSSTTEIARPRRRVPVAIVAVLAATVVVAAASIAIATWLSRRLQVAERPVRAEINLPPAEPLAAVSAGAIALSPDATRLAMLVGTTARASIAVRDLASDEVRVLAGTENATYPFWSPDGKRIGFFADQKLKTIGADGGVVDIVCDVKQGRGGAWSRDGSIVFAGDVLGPIFKVSEAGGAPVAVTSAPKGWTQRNPSFLSDGRTFLFTSRDYAHMPSADLYAASIDGRKPAKRIAQNASSAAVAGDRLFFVRNRNLIAERFDAKTLTASGTPAGIAEDVQYYRPRDIANFSAAGNAIAYVPAMTNPTQIAIFDTTGRLADTKGQPADYTVLDVSPDSNHIALSVGNGTTDDVWILQIDRGVLSRVTFTDTGIVSAAFSPDGSHLAVGAEGGRQSSVFLLSVDGGSRQDVLTDSRALNLNGWSADGKYLLATIQNVETSHDVVYIDLQQRKIIDLIKTPAEEWAPALSPNGKWLAYTSIESGRPQVYVTEFPSARGKWQVTADVSGAARWAADGKRLFFLNAGKVFAADVREGAAPQFGAPVALPVTVPLPVIGVIPNYAIMRDGKIVTLARVGQAPPNAVHLITNWSKLLPP